MKDKWLLLQVIFYFVGIGFAAGGGNHPQLQAGNLIYLKAFCLTFPIIGFCLDVMFNRKMAMGTTLLLLRRNIWLALYLVFAFVSLPLAINTQYSAQRLLYMLYGMIGLFGIMVQYANAYVSTRLYDAVIRHFTVLTAVALVMPIYVAFASDISDWIPGFRTVLQSYLLIHPNLLAAFYVHLLFFHIGIVSLSARPNKIIQILLGLLLLVCVILLFSRAVFVGFVVCSIFCCFLLYQLTRAKKFLVTGFTVIAFLIIVSLLQGTNVLSAFVRDDDFQSMLTLTNRTVLWRTLLETVTIKNFLVGNGYSVMIEGYGVDFGTGILYGAHNAYLSILLGTGIFSLLCIFAYFIQIVYRAWERRKINPVFSTFICLASLPFFMTTCLTGEEIGVNMTVTFAYIVFLFNMFVHPNKAASS